jgi:hypothetical protein
MKRRAFFGIVGGAAVAGPKMAKEVIAKLPSGLGDVASNYPAGYGGTLVNAKSQSTLGPPSTSWRMAEIANLRKILTGEISDEEKEDQRRQRMYAQQSIISQSVASLVSVSGVRKLEMYQDRMADHKRRIQRSEVQSRLHWLLRQND